MIQGLEVTAQEQDKKTLKGVPTGKEGQHCQTGPQSQTGKLQNGPRQMKDQ